jgi:hypothetical protein
MFSCCFEHLAAALSRCILFSSNALLHSSFVPVFVSMLTPLQASSFFGWCKGRLHQFSNQMRSKFSLAALRQTRRVLICQLAAFSWLAWG